MLCATQVIVHYVTALLKIANPRRQLYLDLYGRYFHKDTQNASRTNSNLLKFSPPLPSKSETYVRRRPLLYWTTLTMDPGPPPSSQMHMQTCYPEQQAWPEPIPWQLIPKLVVQLEGTKHLWKHQYHLNLQTRSHSVVTIQKSVFVHVAHIICYSSTSLKNSSDKYY